MTEIKEVHATAEKVERPEPPISRRDAFALAALGGSSFGELGFGTVGKPSNPWPWVAEQCYAAADAMIAASDTHPEPQPSAAPAPALTEEEREALAVVFEHCDNFVGIHYNSPLEVNRERALEIGEAVSVAERAIDMISRPPQPEQPSANEAKAAGEAMFNELCRACLRRILEAPNYNVNEEYPGNVLLRLENLISRAALTPPAPAATAEVEEALSSLRSAALNGYGWGDHAAVEKWTATLRAALAQRTVSAEELERERICHAACGVIANSNTRESFERNRLPEGSPYRSDSYVAVERCVWREMLMRGAAILPAPAKVERKVPVEELRRIANYYFGYDLKEWESPVDDSDSIDECYKTVRRWLAEQEG